jgi:hypothetical protein
MELGVHQGGLRMGARAVLVVLPLLIGVSWYGDRLHYGKVFAADLSSAGRRGLKCILDLT